MNSNPTTEQNVYLAAYFTEQNLYLAAYFVISLIAWCLTNEATAHASRWLNNQIAFGEFSISLRITHNLAHLFVMGQEATLLMYLSKYHANPEKKSGLIYWIAQSTLVKTVILIITVSCTLAIASFYPEEYNSFYITLPILNTSLNMPSQQLLTIFFAMPFIVISGIFERFFLFLKRFFSAFLPRGVYQPILFSTLLYCLPQNMTPNVISALIIYCVSFIMSSIIYALFSYYSGFSISAKKDLSDKKTWHASGLLYTLSTLIIKGTPSLSLFFLKQLGPVENVVGFYAAIATLNYGFHLLTKPFDSYLKPSIATLYHQGQIQELQDKINQINKLRWLIILTLTLTLAIAGHYLLGRYGEDFPLYYSGLVIASVLSCCQYLGQLAHETLNYTNNQSTLSKIMLFQLILIALCAKILIPKFGLIGAIISQGLPCALCTFLSAYMLRKKTGLKVYFAF